MVEVDDVILHALRGDDQVAEDPRVRRRHSADGVLHGPNRRDRVHGRADAADALRERPGIARVASLQDELDPAEHRRGRPRVFDDAAIDFGLDPKVPLDARDRIDDDAAHSGSPFSVGDDDAFGLGGMGSALFPTRLAI